MNPSIFRVWAIAIFFAVAQTLIGQNALVIPPVLTGTTFNLNVQEGTQNFYGATQTPTYGINGPILGPTIIVNKGDSITLNVNNGLNIFTTMHWHGLHVAPQHDGGPHQVIAPSTTWSPSFKVRNNASTFWYHPHGAGQTDPQVSKGLAGLLIIKDSAETALPLPRTYGIDDFPLIIQSKAFDVLQQIAIATDMDTALFVNGTLNPFLDVPEQVVRFRLLNGSSMRNYYVGLSNNQTFYQIGTDGGLIDTPIVSNRLRLGPGERVEVLVNFSGMFGQSVQLMSYASEMQDGIYGSPNVGMGNDTLLEYNANFLNGVNFNLLQLNVIASIPGAITSIPLSLIPFTPFNPALATLTRNIILDTLRTLPMDTPNLAEGPFGMNGDVFNMDSVNVVCYLDDMEIWNLVNNTHVAHPFHIHDIQFNIIERSGTTPPQTDMGWKDVVLVLPHDSVKFVTRFETFSNPTVPYMYHCHMLHHEDDGMMGSFLVIDTNAVGIPDGPKVNKLFSVYPNPASQVLHIVIPNPWIFAFSEITIINILGEKIYSQYLQQGQTDIQLETSNWIDGIYFIHYHSEENIQTKSIIINQIEK